MGVQVLFDSDNERGCLLDSVTETPFGRAFIGMDAAEKLEAFLVWYKTNGAHRDPRVDPNIRDVQDAWLASLDDGCEVCGAEPWEPCDPEAVISAGGVCGEHVRRFTRCEQHGAGCHRQARYESAGKKWCSTHAPRGATYIDQKKTSKALS